MVNFIQNINVNLTGVVPTIATVLTFLVHTLVGLSLNTTDVSTAAAGRRPTTRPGCPPPSRNPDLKPAPPLPVWPGFHHHRHLQRHEVLPGAAAPDREDDGRGGCFHQAPEGEGPLFPRKPRLSLCL